MKGGFFKRFGGTLLVIYSGIMLLVRCITVGLGATAGLAFTVTLGEEIDIY